MASDFNLTTEISFSTIYNITSAILNGSYDANFSSVGQTMQCDPRLESFNCTVEAFLVYMRGPQMLPLPTALSVSLFFLLNPRSISVQGSVSVRCRKLQKIFKIFIFPSFSCRNVKNEKNF